MLSVEEAKALFALLDAESRPFDDISAEYAAVFPRGARFKVCCSIAVCLEDKMLFTPSQRLVAYLIVHQSYSAHPISSNPFVSLFVNAVANDATEKMESTFIQLLLGSAGAKDGKEVLKQTPADYIKGFDQSSYTLLQNDQLWKQHFDGGMSETYRRILGAAAVNNVIPDPDLPFGCDANSSETKPLPTGAKQRIGSEDRGSAITGLLQKSSLEGLRPQFVQPVPPLFPVLDGELMWLNPVDNYELLWDSGMCADASRESAIRNLIAKALKGSLDTAQQEQVEVELSKDPKLVHQCGLTPSKLPDLVEHNPLIALEVLSKLKNFPEITKYFTALVNMEISLHSVEVISRLFIAVDLPREFLHLYIKTYISSCENTKDKYMKNRFVRLFCLSLEFLIRNKIDVHDLSIEVQAFCTKFSRTREATSLLRLLKSSE